MYYVVRFDDYIVLLLSVDILLCNTVRGLEIGKRYVHT